MAATGRSENNRSAPTVATAAAFVASSTLRHASPDAEFRRDDGQFGHLGSAARAIGHGKRVAL